MELRYDVKTSGADQLKQLNAATQELSASIGRIDPTLGALTQRFSTLTGSVSGFSTSTLGMVGIIGSAISSITALAGASVALVKAQGTAAEEMGNFATRLGITVNQADRFQAMAKIAGVNAGTLEAGVRQLAAGLEDTGGAGKHANDALVRLGISTFTLTGEKRQLGTVLLDVVQKLSTITNESERTFLSQRLLGRGAQEIAPLITQYRELDQAARALGFGTREDLIKSLDKADDEFDKLGLAFEVLKTRLAAKIAPIIIPIVQTITRAAAGDTRALAQVGGALIGPGGIAAANIFGLLSPDTITGPKISAPSGDTAILAAGAAQAATLRKMLDGLVRDAEEIAKRKAAEAKTAFQTIFAEADAKLRQGVGGPALAEEKARVSAAFAEMKATEAAEKRITDAKKLRVDATRAVEEAEKRASAAGLDEVGKIAERYADLFDKFGKILTTQERSTLEASRLKEITAQIDEETAKFNLKLDKTNDDYRLLVNSSIELFDKLRATAQEDSLKKLEDRAKAVAQAMRDVTAVEKDAARQDLSSQTGFAARFLQFSTPIGSTGGAQNTALRTIELQKQAAQELYTIEIRGQITAADLRKANLDLARSIRDAEVDGALKVLELEKQRLEQARESAGRIFDALVSGGRTSLADFAKGIILQQGRAVFQNVTEGLFKSTGTAFGGLVSAQSPLAGLLKGTLFEPRDRVSMDVHTQAMLAHARALTIAAGRAGFGGGSSGGGFSTDLSSALRVFGSDTNGLTGQGPLGIGDLPLAVNGRNSLQFGIPGGVPSGNGQGTLGALSRFGGSGLLAAGGALAAVSGFRSGGGRGIFQGAAGVAGIVGGLLPLISQSLMFAGPIGMIAGSVLALASTLFGDPKQARRDFIESTLQNSKFTAQPVISAVSDIGGGYTDVDRFGNTRVSGGLSGFSTPGSTINVNVMAMDSKSFVDHAGDIHDAVQYAIRQGGRSELIEAVRDRV